MGRTDHPELKAKQWRLIFLLTTISQVCWSMIRIFIWISPILSSSKVYKGNYEDKFTSLRNIQNNKIMNHSSEQIFFYTQHYTVGTAIMTTVVQSIYHINYEVLVCRSQTLVWCASCKIQWLYVVIRMKEWTLVVIFLIHACLHQKGWIFTSFAYEVQDLKLYS